MNTNKICRSLLALGLVSLGFVACDKDEDKAVVTATTPAQALTASSSNVVLNKSNLASDVLTLSWQAAQFSYSNTLVHYTLIITRTDATDGEVKSLEVALGETTSKKFQGEELNKILAEQMKVESKVAHPYTFVIKAYPYQAGGASSTSVPGSATSSSEPISITLTAADLVREDFYFVGNIFDAAHAWANAYTGFPLFTDHTKSTDYTYTGYFAAGEFKLIAASNLGSWSTLLGTTEPGKMTYAGGNTNFKLITTPGYYTFSMNPESMTYTFAPYPAATTAPIFTSMALIGTAVGGWDADKVSLSQTSYDPHIWTATGVVLSAGEFKFRADSDWGKSWGKKSDTFPISKIGDSGDDNIRVSAGDAGTYFVLFNDLTKHFYFKKQS